MKLVKKILAVAVVFALVATLFCGCQIHEKDETVVTVGDTTIGSELYLMYLMQADYTFKQGVDSALKEAGSDAVSDNAAYYKQTLDDKDADTWIKDKCLEYCKTYAWTLQTFDKYGLTLTDDEKSNVDQYVYYYWTYYGYSSYYEENGVSEAAFRLYYEELLKEESIFNYLYGEGGTEEVAEDDVFDNIKETYIFAETLTLSTKDSEGNAMDEAAVATVAEQAQGYADRINSGADTIATVTTEYNGKDGEESTSSDTSSSTSSDTASSEEEEKVKSVYADAKVYSADDSDATIHDALADEIKKETFEYDKAFSVTTDSGIVVYVVRNMDLDKEYLLDNYTTTALHNLKDDTFSDLKTAGIGELTADASKSLVKRYKPENITEQKQ